MNFHWLRKNVHFFVLLLVSLIVTFIFRFPDVYAYLTTPSGMVFLGQNSWFDPQDINTYVSVIHYTQSGHVLLPNLWTALPNQSISIFPIEQLLGFFFRSVNPYLLFWITSIFCGVLLIIGMYYLVHKTIPSIFLAAITTLGISLGGGFGFFLYPKIASLDMVGGITFYETFFKPHEAISIFCYLYGMVMFYEVFIKAPSREFKNTLFISFALITSFLLYPYLIALYFLTTIPFLFFVKKKPTYKEMLLIFAGPLLPVIFVSYQLSLNSGFYAPFLQHLSVDPGATLFGYGLLIPIFLCQLFFMKKIQFEKYLSWWIICAFVLAFLPFGPGRIFLRGILFPLVLLSVLQIQILIKKISFMPLRTCYWTIFFVLLCATNFYIFYLRFAVLQTNQATDIIYMPQDEFNIFDYLNTHTLSGSGILAGSIMSNLIPAYTDDRSCIGSLWSFNTTYNTELNIVNAFYAGQPASKDYLKENNVSYVLWGPNEQQLTARYAHYEITDLRQFHKNLKLVYQTDTTKLYKVE